MPDTSNPGAGQSASAPSAKPSLKSRLVVPAAKWLQKIGIPFANGRVACRPGQVRCTEPGCDAMLLISLDGRLCYFHGKGTDKAGNPRGRHLIFDPGTDGRLIILCDHGHATELGRDGTATIINGQHCAAPTAAASAA